MTQALAYEFPVSSDNGNEPSQSFGLDANFSTSQDSRSQGYSAANMLNTVDRQPQHAEPNSETGLRQNGGPHGQSMCHQENGVPSRPGNTEYDNFLAITGLGVKLPSQGSDAGSRLGASSDLDRLKQQPQQGIPPSLQEYLNGMSRPTSSGQILNLHSRLPQPVSSHTNYPEHAPPPGISQDHQQNAKELPGSIAAQMGSNGFQAAQADHAMAPESGAKPTDEKEQALPAPASDIQQLLFNISMPQMNGISRSSSRSSILNLNSAPPAPATASIADVLAAVQPQPQPPKTDPSSTDAPAPEAPQPVQASDGPETTPSGAPSLQPGISAFAAVADSPLDEDASKAPMAASGAPAQQDAPRATQALPPPQVKPGALGGPQLAQNLFDPPFPTVASSSSFTAEPPAIQRLGSGQDGLLSRVPNPEHAALLQQLQQFAPEASNEDLLRALHTHILQQAQLQQRASAQQAPQNGELLCS